MSQDHPDSSPKVWSGVEGSGVFVLGAVAPFFGSEMIGSFLTRGLVMIFGYAYPAYECYKTVEKNRPEIEQLRFWCQYWILVAVLTVFERVGDIFISWVPMYSEAKLAFFIYLWYPKTRGTTYVYDSFFKPYLAKHETEIDRNLLELRARAGDIAVLYWRQAITYGQTRIFEVLQYVSAQSTTRPCPTQPQEQHAGAAAEPPQTAQTQQPATTSRAKPQKQPADASNASSTSQQSRTSPADANTQEQHQTTEQEVDSAAAASPPPVSPKPAATHPQTKDPNLLTKKAASAQSLAEAMQTDSPTSSSASESTNPPSQETVMEETIRVTRGRLRKTRASSSIH